MKIIMIPLALLVVSVAAATALGALVVCSATQTVQRLPYKLTDESTLRRELEERSRWGVDCVHVRGTRRKGDKVEVWAYYRRKTDAHNREVIFVWARAELDTGLYWYIDGIKDGY